MKISFKRFLWYSIHKKNNDSECYRPKCEYCGEYFVINIQDENDKSIDKSNYQGEVKKLKTHTRCKAIFNQRYNDGVCVRCGGHKQHSYHDICKKCKDENRPYVGYN